MRTLAILRVSDLDDDQLLLIRTMNGAVLADYLVAHVQHLVSEVVPVGRVLVVTLVGGQNIFSLMVPTSIPLRVFHVTNRRASTGDCLFHDGTFWCGARPVVGQCPTCHTPLCATHVGMCHQD